MKAESLLALAADAAGEHRTQDVLTAIVRGLSKEPGVALARIWLQGAGDICPVCPLREDCRDRTQCLHLIVSDGVPLRAGAEPWTGVRGSLRRVPFEWGKIGEAGATGKPALVQDASAPGVWPDRPDWVESEQIVSLVCLPLVSRAKRLGVLGVFSRSEIQEQEFEWLTMFAGQAAVAIANATAFEDLLRADAALRDQARQFQQVIDVAPVHMFLWEGDASASYGNRTSLEYFGPIPPKAPMEFLELVTHPDDFARVKEGILRAIPRGEAFSVEARMKRHDGRYRWFLYQIYPLRDDAGKIRRWCGTRTDIEEQKHAQEATQKENLALREEIDKVSMFEEIVGTSPALQTVLARVAKVAATDSTVLVTGETGTGKELIARAIHKRSSRSEGPFVSVNCAAVPRDLIASELFGHEKGAFTGALQRRLGRFEMAEGGTIFLDEIGELPAETQVALLRVLQEKEFQRVGGSQTISVDARVIAATHRNLPAAIEAGTFREDLFYRINVFPIEVPPLRERQEDVRLLVEYFIDRYSNKAGKKITNIDRRSMEKLQAYPWPGNIRELQNVIERSVIVCETENFSVDESWLSHKSGSERPLSEELESREKERIEAALAEAKGRVSGPTGAAAKLGMPPSTLDSKIKSLRIDKHRFHRV